MERSLWLPGRRKASVNTYEELTDNPHGMLTELFSACGLPVSEVDAALKAFEQDSQAGTPLSRENTRRDGEDFVLPKHEAEIEAIIREFPQVGIPDVILPGTIGTSSKR